MLLQNLLLGKWFFAIEFCQIDSSLAAKTLFLFFYNPQKRHTEVWIFYAEIQKVHICTCDTDQRILYVWVYPCLLYIRFTGMRNHRIRDSYGHFPGVPAHINLLGTKSILNVLAFVLIHCGLYAVSYPNVWIVAMSVGLITRYGNINASQFVCLENTRNWTHLSFSFLYLFITLIHIVATFALLLISINAVLLICKPKIQIKHRTRIHQRSLYVVQIEHSNLDTVYITKTSSQNGFLVRSCALCEIMLLFSFVSVSVSHSIIGCRICSVLLCALYGIACCHSFQYVARMMPCYQLSARYLYI